MAPAFSIARRSPTSDATAAMPSFSLPVAFIVSCMNASLRRATANHDRERQGGWPHLAL
jgi:hypothetical protein